MWHNYSSYLTSLYFYAIMVSLWPWKGQDDSPASFEKILSTLSKKITDTQAQLDRQRTNSRRLKVLWTLYLTFAYLVYAIVLTLVVGWQKLGALEWTGMAGGPVLIYVVRTVTTTYFNYRIETLEARLKEYQAERAKTIQKLKDATKYDSTLELLEKYGGEKRSKLRRQATGDEENGDAEKKGANKRGSQHHGHHPHHQPGRTSMLPPPTANIQRPSTAPGISPSHQQTSFARPPPTIQEPTAEFAPNADDFEPNNAPPLQPPYAYTPRPQHEAATAVPAPPRWYDRILDLMLGEDETVPKNRIVLICRTCRLVNGQAPPGTKSLAELGSWKCMSCGAMNGELDEGQKIMREVLGGGGGRAGGGQSSDVGSVQGDSDRSSDIVKVDGSQDSGDDGEEDSKPRTRSQNRRS